jgi:hypothetical protein
MEMPITRVRGASVLTTSPIPAINPLAADRPLAGDDRRIVKGRNLGQAAFADQPIHLALGLVLAAAQDSDLGTFRSDSRPLVRRHEPGHADRAGDTQAARHEGDGAAMVAGGDRDHAAGPLLAVELEKRIGRAPELEAAGWLQILRLGKDFPAERVG